MNTQFWSTWKHNLFNECRIQKCFTAFNRRKVTTSLSVCVYSQVPSSTFNEFVLLCLYFSDIVCHNNIEFLLLDSLTVTMAWRQLFLLLSKNHAFLQLGSSKYVTSIILSDAFIIYITVMWGLVSNFSLKYVVKESDRIRKRQRIFFLIPIWICI